MSDRPRYVLVDVRNIHDTEEDALRAAPSMPGYNDGYVMCFVLERVHLRPAHPDMHALITEGREMRERITDE